MTKMARHIGTFMELVYTERTIQSLSQKRTNHVINKKL